VIDNGTRKRMTKAEIHLRQLFTKAIQGDLSAARLLVGMAAEYSAPEDGEGYDTETARQIDNLALKKRMQGAARLLHNLRKQFPGKLILVVSDDDMKL